MLRVETGSQMLCQRSLGHQGFERTRRLSDVFHAFVLCFKVILRATRFVCRILFREAEELDQILHSGFSSLVRSSAVPRPVQRPLHPFFPKDAERLLFSGCDGAMEKYGQMPAVLVHNDVSQMFKDPEMPRGGSRVFADENPAAVW